MIAELCLRNDAIAITDEIYEHITYDGAATCRIASLPGMKDRTVTISALSKTYAVTGWRVGWAIVAPGAERGIRSVHDFMTVAAPAPLQIAGIDGDGAAAVLLREIGRRIRGAPRHDAPAARRRGSSARPPQGAYYVMADVSHLGLGDDVETATSWSKRSASPRSPVRRSSHLPSSAAPGQVRLLQEARDP